MNEWNPPARLAEKDWCPRFLRPFGDNSDVFFFRRPPRPANFRGEGEGLAVFHAPRAVEPFRMKPDADFCAPQGLTGPLFCARFPATLTSARCPSFNDVANRSKLLADSVLSRARGQNPSAKRKKDKFE